MYRRTYDSELDKGLADFQNASPDAVVRSCGNRRIPGDGNLETQTTRLEQELLSKPEDFQLTAGAGIILGGRGQGLRIVDFDTGQQIGKPLNAQSAAQRAVKWT